MRVWRVLRGTARAARVPTRTPVPNGRKLASAAAGATICWPLMVAASAGAMSWSLCDAGPDHVPVPDDDDEYADVSALQQWDEDWDGRAPGPESDGDDDAARAARRFQRGAGVRYIILVRHGQYETHGADDEHRGLTALGHRQAELAGARIAAMLAPADAGGDVSFGGARYRVAAAAAVRQRRLVRHAPRARDGRGRARRARARERRLPVARRAPRATARPRCARRPRARTRA